MKREETTKTIPVSMLETIADVTDKTLIFPTKEMRDAFYKNFQSEITPIISNDLCNEM